MSESSHPKEKLEIRYYGISPGQTSTATKTKEEVKELVERFLELPIEGLEVHFKWIQKEADPVEPEIVFCSCGKTFDWENWDGETLPCPKGAMESIRHLHQGHTLMKRR